MSLLEIVWVTLVIVIIAIILVTDPKTSNIGINNNIITSNLDSQRFVRKLSWILIGTFLKFVLKTSSTCSVPVPCI